jgi:curved DNA-binding protein CbpA
MTDTATYYDLLNIPQNADQSAIRKAYLRASLACHPDKNPGNEAEAKAKFIEIGEAYNVLKDPASRATYDRELATGRCRERRRQRYSNNAGTKTTDPQTEKEFKNFMDMFDSTVAGMSPEELNMAIGAASVVGSVIGSIMGARAGKGNSFLASAASMVGSAMASQAAAALVKTVHEDSTQRVLEKQDRDAAIARGENVPESSSSERLLKDAFGAVQKMAAAAAAFATPLSQDMPNATNEQSHSAQFQSNAGFQRNVSFGNNGSIRFTFGNGSNTNSARTRTNSARMRANSTRGRNSFT